MRLHGGSSPSAKYPRRTRTDLRTRNAGGALLRIRRPRAVLGLGEREGHEDVHEVARGDVGEGFVRAEEREGRDAGADGGEVGQSGLHKFLRQAQYEWPCIALVYVLTCVSSSIVGRLNAFAAVVKPR